MYKTTQAELLIKVTKQRNLLLYASATSLFVIVILTLTLFRQDRVTVIVPGYTGNQFSVSTRGVSREYLELVSKDIISTLLNITPYNYEYVREKVLKITSPEKYGKVKQEIEQMIDDLNTRQISLRFTPTKLELNEESLTSDISGYLTSYVGIKQTENLFSKYRLGFEYEGGALMLIEFQDLTKKAKP